ncbi:MAG: YdeI/OmpD-associated family protein [Chitinophagales bacterium]
MVQFNAIILRFSQQGEKTGWSYIAISADVAQQLIPGNKKSFRVKGRLDGYAFKGVSLLPMGNGSFIMALNATVRKKIGKTQGHKVKVVLEPDLQHYLLEKDFVVCLKDEPAAFDYFNTLPKSHQNYFSKWIESARTEATKARRIAMAIRGLSFKHGYGEVLRAQKTNSDN